MVIIASFDVGKKNLAWYVEESKGESKDKIIRILNLNVIEIKNRKDLFSKLELYNSIWKECNYIIIEDQQRYRSKNNIIMIQIAESLFSWFSIKYCDAKILYFKPHIRTKILGYKKMSYYQRKKKSIDDAIKFYKTNNFDTFVDFYMKKKVLYPSFLKELYQQKKYKKLDDLSDACMQCQVFKIIKKL